MPIFLHSKEKGTLGQDQIAKLNINFILEVTQEEAIAVLSFLFLFLLENKHRAVSPSVLK